MPDICPAFKAMRYKVCLHHMCLVQILWTYILSQAAAASVSATQPVSKGDEPEPLTFPQQVAIFLTEEEQIAAMQLVVEELASNPSPEETPAEPASAK